MRPLKLAAPCALALFVLAWMCFGQEQGPLPEPGQTVSKKKNSDSTAAPAETTLPKIPSQYKKDKQDLGDIPTFKTDVDVVTLDVAVVDGSGQFIPGIPPVKFRVLEDNVPQQIQKVSIGEAPMTVALLVEFSNVFQHLYSSVWYQTLQLSWGRSEERR